MWGKLGEENLNCSTFHKSSKSEEKFSFEWFFQGDVEKKGKKVIVTRR